MAALAVSWPITGPSEPPSPAATSGAAGLVRAEPSALDSANAAGTTLDRVAVPGKARKGGYRKLTEGAGWPLYVRQELAAARSGRDSRRTALASFVQAEL